MTLTEIRLINDPIQSLKSASLGRSLISQVTWVLERLAEATRLFFLFFVFFMISWRHSASQRISSLLFLDQCGPVQQRLLTKPKPLQTLQCMAQHSRASTSGPDSKLRYFKSKLSMVSDMLLFAEHAFFVTVGYGLGWGALSVLLCFCGQPHIKETADATLLLSKINSTLLAIKCLNSHFY